MSEEQIKIVYVPIQVDKEPEPDNFVEFKKYTKNELTGKYDIVLHIENVACNPIQSLSQVMRSGKVHTKIKFYNGETIYSPTTYDRLKDLMEISVNLMYVKKTE